MKIFLGVDYGARRIGLALGNDEAKLAEPYLTVTVDDGYWERLKRILGDEGVDELVVGLPRTLDGNETPQTKEARFFASQLAVFKLPIHLQDEAGTTEEALSRKPGPAGVDADAAAIILQDYLDSL